MPHLVPKALATVSLASALLLALVVLAPAARPDATLPAAAASGPVPLSLAGCEYVEIGVKVDPARTRPLVPAPFQIRIHPVDGTSLVLLGGASCADATSGDAAGTGTFGWTSVALAPVTDPALSGSGVTFFLYRLEHFVVDGDVYRQVADAAGAERIVAEVDPAVGPAASTLAISWYDFRHDLVNAGTPPVPADLSAPVHWREYHVVDGGVSYLDATLVGGIGASNAPATVLPAPGSLAHAALGDANAGLGTYGSAYEVRDGSMGLVPS